MIKNTAKVTFMTSKLTERTFIIRLKMNHVVH